MTGPLVIFGQIVMFLYIPLIWVVDGAQNKSGEVAVNHETALQCAERIEGNMLHPQFPHT